MKIRTIVLTLAVLVISSTMTCATVSEDARKIADANKDAIVTVSLVIETTSTYGGESNKREGKISATGTVIDPSGLVVASLAAINPTDMFSRFADEDEGFKVSTRVIDVKIRTADGTEIPADVVLRDRDLDLGFIKPKKAPETPLAFVDLTQASTPEMMDELVMLNRLGQVGSRALAGTIDRVQAVVTKPRTFYVVSGMISGIGFPAFTTDGKPAGILTMRLSQSKDDNEASLGSADKVLAVVLPCSTVQKAAEQAKVAKPIKEEAPKAAEPKPAAKPTAKPAAKPAK